MYTLSEWPRGLRAALRLGGGVLMFGVVLFGSAGTLDFWEAWAFMVVLFAPMTAGFVYFARRNPDVLERRMEQKETRPRQRLIIGLATVTWLLVFAVPGLDRRFGWSGIPLPVVVCADLATLAGYILVLRVLLENPFASRSIGVGADQRVVTTGPYAAVRHPMYLGFTVIMLSAPLALGSYWALVPAAATPVILVFRLLDEEQALLDGLPGYREYAAGTHRRLIPGIW